MSHKIYYYWWYLTSKLLYADTLIQKAWFSFVVWFGLVRNLARIVIILAGETSSSLTETKPLQRREIFFQHFMKNAVERLGTDGGCRSSNTWRNNSRESDASFDSVFCHHDDERPSQTARSTYNRLSYLEDEARQLDSSRVRQIKALASIDGYIALSEKHVRWLYSF